LDWGWKFGPAVDKFWFYITCMEEINFKIEQLVLYEMGNNMARTFCRFMFIPKNYAAFLKYFK
jgi:hypothetical protein